MKNEHYSILMKNRRKLLTGNLIQTQKWSLTQRLTKRVQYMTVYVSNPSRGFQRRTDFVPYAFNTRGEAGGSLEEVFCSH